MIRLSILLTILVCGTPLLAQSVISNLPQEERYANVTLMKYCAKIERQSHSLQSRIFAQVYPGLGLFSGWKEFGNREVWRGAGKPKPVAIVWYKDGQAVRVAITNSADGRLYTDYCYRADGTLAELRSVPVIEKNCDESLLHCDVRLNAGLLLYAPTMLTTRQAPVLDRIEEGDLLGASPLNMLMPERVTFSFAPMQWPAFLHVSELPFNDLLYVCTNN